MTGLGALVLGTPADVRAFALAGVEGRVCEDLRDLDQALAAARARADLALLVLSPEVAALAPARIQALAAREPPPSLLVLP